MVCLEFASEDQDPGEYRAGIKQLLSHLLQESSPAVTKLMQELTNTHTHTCHCTYSAMALLLFVDLAANVKCVRTASCTVTSAMHTRLAVCTRACGNE